MEFSQTIDKMILKAIADSYISELKTCDWKRRLQINESIRYGVWCSHIKEWEEYIISIIGQEKYYDIKNYAYKELILKCYCNKCGKKPNSFDIGIRSSGENDYQYFRWDIPDDLFRCNDCGKWYCRNDLVYIADNWNFKYYYCEKCMNGFSSIADKHHNYFGKKRHNNYIYK
jgi:hypothetical protein